MKQEELNKILELHEKWLDGEEDGVKADLEIVNLESVNLEGANLQGANLRNADLSFANLYKADLKNADLRNADLSFARNIYTFTAYDTSKRTVYCVRHKDTFMCQAGCFYGTLDELETKVKEEHNSKVYLGNIAIMREILKDNN